MLNYTWFCTASTDTFFVWLALMKWQMNDNFHCQSNQYLKSSPSWWGSHTNNLVPRYGTSHNIIRHVHKHTNRVQGNQTLQDLVGNNRWVILTEKINQNLFQCRRIIGMLDETSMLAGVLEIGVKCRCYPPNAEDVTGLQMPYIACSMHPCLFNYSKL